MPYRIHTVRLTGLWLGLAATASGMVLGACGGSSPATTISGRAVSASNTSSARSTRPRARPGAVAFAACMRANGVPDFPDPKPGGGELFAFPPGVSPQAPAVRAAQAKCQRLLSGIAAPGGGAPPSTQTLVKLRKIAQCMREHGIPDFPDPRATKPSSIGPGKYSDITDFDGAFLLFPTTFDVEAPAYRKALAACHAPPLGLPH